MQARKKLFEKRGADFAPGPYTVIFFFRSAASLESRASPEKADGRGGGGGGTLTLFFSFLKA